MLINGKLIAAKILDKLRLEVIELKKTDITPALAVILIGDDPSSKSYIRQKNLKADYIGAKVIVFNYPEDVTEDVIIEKVENLNNDKLIHGIIIQQPVPSHLNIDKLIKLTDPRKDIDGFHENTSFIHPIALAVWEILEKISEINSADITTFLKNKHICIIGQGRTAGQPIANYLTKKDVRFTTLNSKTKDIQEELKNANIVISAVGKNNIFKPELLKSNAVIISVGMSLDENKKLVADYKLDNVLETQTYTPVPGGVGPVNVAMLLSNLIRACKK